MKCLEPYEEISAPIRIRLTDVTEPAQGNPFSIVSHLEHRARVQRVGKLYKNVTNVSTPFTIQWAGEMSLIRGPTSISIIEEAPLVFSIDNVSSLALGLGAEKPRILRSLIRIEYNGEIS